MIQQKQARPQERPQEGHREGPREAHPLQSSVKGVSNGRFGESCEGFCVYVVCVANFKSHLGGQELWDVSSSYWGSCCILWYFIKYMKNYLRLCI
jgi:hypothetical protein